jgi:hypothetical protein
MPSGPAGNHLFVVITDESPDGEFLLVSVSTIRNGRFHDATCEIEAGVHEFIKARSYTHYGAARVERGTRLVHLEKAGVFIAREAMPEEVVQAIAAGIEVSEHTPNFAQKFYRLYLKRLS